MRFLSGQGLRLSLIFAIGTVLLAAVHPAFAQDGGKAEARDEGITYGTGKRSNYGLFSARAGVSLMPRTFYSDPVDKLDGSVGPQLGLGVGYVISNIFYAGLLAEYDFHKIDLHESGMTAKAGTLHTFAIMPVVGVRAPVQETKFLVNATAGLGANLNRFKNVGGSTLDLKPGHNLAVRLSLGGEYEFEKDVSMTADAVYRFNQGTFDSAAGSADYKADTLAFLLGVNLKF